MSHNGAPFLCKKQMQSIIYKSDAYWYLNSLLYFQKTLQGFHMSVYCMLSLFQIRTPHRTDSCFYNFNNVWTVKKNSSHFVLSALLWFICSHVNGLFLSFSKWMTSLWASSLDRADQDGKEHAFIFLLLSILFQILGFSQSWENRTKWCVYDLGNYMDRELFCEALSYFLSQTCERDSISVVSDKIVEWLVQVSEQES